MNERIFFKVMVVITEKMKTLHVNEQQLDDAMEEIRYAHTIKSLSTCRTSNLNYGQLNYRCAYLFRHFTCIAVVTRRMWHRFYSANNEISFAIDLLMAQGSVNVCSIGGGPATDLLGFYMFLTLNYDISHVQINGVILEKHIQWMDMFAPLRQLFNRSNNMANVKYSFFDFFDTPGVNAVKAIASADVVSIVKFLSAVGYDRNKSERKIEVLLKSVGHGVPVFFMDNSGGGYMRSMENAARNAQFRLIAKIEHKQMRVPCGEKIEMDRWNQYFVLNPQKNPCVSAAVWIR
uniref:Uncharacterized protein n=1 Tax=Strigamia maritima TaxID=126957 RepID=T1J5K8_STRMM